MAKANVTENATQVKADATPKRAKRARQALKSAAVRAVELPPIAAEIVPDDHALTVTDAASTPPAPAVKPEPTDMVSMFFPEPAEGWRKLPPLERVVRYADGTHELYFAGVEHPAEIQAKHLGSYTRVSSAIYAATHVMVPVIPGPLLPYAMVMFANKLSAIAEDSALGEELLPAERAADLLRRFLDDAAKEELARDQYTSPMRWIERERRGLVPSLAAQELAAEDGVTVPKTFEPKEERNARRIRRYEDDLDRGRRSKAIPDRVGFFYDAQPLRLGSFLRPYDLSGVAPDEVEAFELRDYATLHRVIALQASYVSGWIEDDLYHVVASRFRERAGKIPARVLARVHGVVEVRNWFEPVNAKCAELLRALKLSVPSGGRPRAHNQVIVVDRGKLG